MIRFTPQKILDSKILFGFVLLISIVPSLVDLNYLAFSRFLSFAPFFILGWKLREVDIIVWLSTLPKIIRILIVALSIPCCILATKIPVGIFWGHEPLGLPIMSTVIYKILAWIMAIINSLTLCIIIPRKLSIKDGRNTLSYYLFHTIILYPILLYLSAFIPSNSLTTVAVLIAVLTILHYIAKNRYVNSILNIKPVTLYIHMKEKCKKRISHTR